MGSSYFGEPNMSGSSSSTSRKGKKSNSDKPKQPQRGLGVAQLEKIRLHGQMACDHYHPNNSFHNPYPTNFNKEDMMTVQTPYSSIPSSSFSNYSSSSSPTSYGYHPSPSISMGLGDNYERSNIIYGDSQPTTTASWNPVTGISNTQHFTQPNMNRHLQNLPTEDPQQIKRSKKHRSSSVGSSSQNSESSDTQEVDLELRLSI